MQQAEGHACDTHSTADNKVHRKIKKKLDKGCKMCYYVGVSKRHIQHHTHKEDITMFNNYRRKEDTNLYKVTYRFIGEQETFTTTATSAGLSSIFADWEIEVLEAVII